MNIKIGVSARHIHLNQEDLDTLFGNSYQLTKLHNLSQTGDYACGETLTIKTDKDQIDNVRILGPVRDYTQIEISETDAYKLGLNPPVRNSGDIEGSESITLVGPNNEIYKDKGCIIATRHIHANSSEAKEYGLSENQQVKVRFSSEKAGIIENVYIKINDSYNLELHIDLDDANAHLVKNGDEGELIINE